ncbi:MAG TPA: bifunctional DNA primase/polymerase [Chloroflexia bacterium]|jgi:murein DD-endopeptidase MepM/ murein hydrolase activator NlpD
MTAPTKPTLRDQFYTCLEHGYSVIPLQPGSKKPLLQSWKEYQERLPTPEEVDEWLRKWPDANLGIVTGAVSRLVVVDVDRDHGGEESLPELLPDPLPDCEIVQTPHGRHLYFRHPGPGRRIANRVGIHPGIDIRGDGGYVVGPGSVVDGIEYVDLSEATEGSDDVA